MTEGRPLTPAQAQMWAGQQLLDGVPLYNMVLAFELFGEIDVERFERAFDRLVACSDALRTRFVDTADGTVVREVMEAESGHLRRVRLESGARWQEMVQEVTETPIPTDGWMFRSGLIDVGPGHHVWYLAQHHLITDGWGVRVVYERLVEIYEGGERGTFPQFEERPIAVAPQSLVEAQPERSTPSIYGRAPDTAGSTRVDRVDVPLAPDVVSAVESRVGDASGPLTEIRRFAVYATALAATLARVGSDDRFTLLMPVRNRRARADRETPGMFIEIRGVSVDVRPLDSLRELERQLLDATRDTLVESNGTAAPSLHRTAPALLNVIGEAFEPFPGCRMRTHWFHSGHGDREQAVRMQIHDFDGEGAWVIQFELNRSVFDADRERLFMRHFDVALREAIFRPGTSIAEIPLLDHSEIRALERFNDTYAETLPVLERIESAVRRSPDRPAVADGAETISYRSLWDRAGEAAVGLQRRSLAPVVGLHLERSSDLVVALVATIRAGGTFVPIPTTTPPDRLDMLEATAGLDLVVSDTWRPSTIEELSLDDLREVGELEDRSSPEHAYVMFTSGSTGTPKGVGVTPANLANYVDWAAHTYGAGPITMPLFTSIGFDLTLTSALIPLATGGTVVTFPSNDEYTVLEVLDDPRVDLVKLTPSHLRMLDDAQLATSSARGLILGGENLERSAAARAHDAGLTVFNEYGPTEATVGCMAHRFDPASDTDPSVPLGRPAANTEIRVQDRHGGLVPIGVVGELWIGGAGVAAGYVGRPDLTDERFIELAGQRWYRTGDLARWSRPEVLEFLGRADDQVKIRGHRVELGEVETALLDHAEVLAAAASTRQDVDGASQLVGYYVGTIDEAALRQDLGRRLPSALIPSYLVPMQAMPLTENGKVDRSRLPDPMTRATTGRSPSGRAETALADVWAEVLGTSAITADIGFLEAGGDSILAIRTATVARKAGLRVRPSDLLLNATIADVAPTAIATVDTPRRPLVPSAPLTSMQRWLVGLGSEALAGWAQAMTLSLGGVDPDRVVDAWNAVIAETPILRSSLAGGRLTVGPTVEVTVGVPDDAALAEALDPTAGRMVGIGFQGDHMIAVVHHLVVDAVSWQPLLDRLATALHSPKDIGVAAPESRDFLEWADTLHRWTAAGRFDDERDRWEPYFERDPSIGSPERFTEQRIEGITGMLDPHRTVAAPQEMLAAALVQSIGSETVVVDVESHGRPPSEDLEATIGWLTTIAPITVQVEEDLVGTLRHAKDSMRSVPNLGLGYGALATSRGAPIGVGDVAFNFLGRSGPATTPFDPAGPLRLVRPPGVGTTHPVTLDAWIEDDALCAHWTHAESIDGTLLARRFDSVLRSMVDGLDHNAALTPSDFPRAGLDANELSELLDRFGDPT